MVSVLGLDLGSSWHSTGSALLSIDEGRWISCTPGAIVWPKSICNAPALAEAILAFALKNEIRAVSLDGPQGWRDPGTPGSFVGRDCERLTKTPGKTGKFGVAIPRTWIRWIRCSIEVFDRLLSTQHTVLVNDPEIQGLPAPPNGKFYILECFPTSTWRQAQLKPLPGHHIDAPTIRRFADDLREAFGLPDTLPSGHDDLQAIVAALPAAALLGGPCQAVPKGLPARMIAAQDETSMHRAEGIIWDAMPVSELDVSIAPNPQPVPIRESKSYRSAESGEKGVDRGVRLFSYLVESANCGNAVGIAYGGFLAYLQGFKEFREAAGRNFRPSDAAAAVRMAQRITEAAGGRKKIARSGCTIHAGMDTFIWNAKPPFDRPEGAWRYPIPYTREEWLLVFPHGSRRLITATEVQLITARE